MQKRTRLFLLIAAGILFAGLGTGLLAAYRGGFQNLVLIGADGPDELAYVPASARMVAFADVHAIMQSDLRRKFHPETAAGSGANKFQEETGIDVERDVDHIVAFASAAVADATNARPLMLARGRFDAVRIEGSIRNQGGVVEDYKGKRVFSHPEQHIAVAFLEPDLVAAGTPEAVHEAIDVKAAGTGTIRSNADVMRLVRDSDNGTAWAVARLDAVTASGRLPGDVVKQLPAVNWFAITGHIDDGVRGTIRAEARDEQAAKDLAEVVRGFMALARLQVGQRAEFAALLNSLELSGTGKTVTLNFAVPGEVLDTLAAARPHRPAQPAQ
jgi:hypothetical protein